MATVLSASGPARLARGAPSLISTARVTSMFRWIWGSAARRGITGLYVPVWADPGAPAAGAVRV